MNVFIVDDLISIILEDLWTLDLDNRSNEGITNILIFRGYSFQDRKKRKRNIFESGTPLCSVRVWERRLFGLKSVVFQRYTDFIAKKMKELVLKFRKKLTCGIRDWFPNCLEQLVTSTIIYSHKK